MTMEIPTDWTFKNINVAAGFDRHVREQLPWYDLVTGAVAHVARHYLPEGGLVYDVGASTGNVGRALDEVIRSRSARLVAIDNSPQMANIYAGPGEIVVANALEFEFEPFDVAIAMLVMMFMPPERRRVWLNRLCAKIKPGGAVIIVDKCDGPGGYLSTVMHRLTIAGKVSTGVQSEEIVEKELSLSGVQRPIPESFMSFSVPGAHEFFRFGEFAGWVIVRPE